MREERQKSTPLDPRKVVTDPLSSKVKGTRRGLKRGMMSLAEGAVLLWGLFVFHRFAQQYGLLSLFEDVLKAFR